MPSLPAGILLGVVVLAGILAAAEIAFRLWYRRRFGRPYSVTPRVAWARMYVVAHPFLSFAYRRNWVITHNKRLPYPLHPNRYWSFHTPLRLNALGHFGPDWAPEKAPGSIRIACLGASTTANTIATEDAGHCYPDLLAGHLRRHLEAAGDRRPVEVLNCGIGGWTSADILINFCLNIVHLKPDYIVLYHGHNDLPLHLMHGVETDYSHGLRGLGEVLPRIRAAHRWPKLPFWQSYEWLRDRLLGTGDVRNDVLAMIRTRPQDLAKPDPWATLGIEEENLRSLLAVARHHGMRAVLGTFCLYVHRTDGALPLLAAGVEAENRRLAALAAEFSAILVDQAAAMPRSPDYFVDAMHFTPAGMDRLAATFAAALAADLRPAGATDVPPAR